MFFFFWVQKNVKEDVAGNYFTDTKTHTDRFGVKRLSYVRLLHTCLKSGCHALGMWTIILDGIALSWSKPHYIPTDSMKVLFSAETFHALIEIQLLVVTSVFYLQNLSVHCLCPKILNGCSCSTREKHGSYLCILDQACLLSPETDPTSGCQNSGGESS